LPINKPPAFQFYPKDFLSDLNVQCMDAEARGIYITLLCNCWIENSIPNNPDIIEPLLNRGSTDVEHKANQWEKIRRCFYEKKGRLFHKRLEVERDKQKKFKKSQSDKGKLSGIARKKTSEPRFNSGSTDVQPDVNSSIFGFQSSNKEKNILSSKQNNKKEEIKAPPNKPKEEIKENIKTIVSYLNEKTGKAFHDDSKSAKKHISGRLSEGFAIDDFKTVIDNKAGEWMGDPKFEKFLRPETLFCLDHFESYLNEKGKKAKGMSIAEAIEFERRGEY